MRTLATPLLKAPPMRITTLLLLLAALASAAPAWHPDLACSGGGVWTVRVTVTVTNTTKADAAGTPVELTVGTEKGQLLFAGQPLAGIRICEANGDELLYDVLDAQGRPKRQGNLTAGDKLVFGVECARSRLAEVYVYTDNAKAWPVPDGLGAGAPFLNGGFEEGGDPPLAWSQGEASADHRLSVTDEEPHGGNACTRCDVDPEAPASWVKWTQTDIRVAPDAEYRFEAWVRGRDVKGSAGWFVHVHGRKGLVVNRTLKSDEGLFGWKRVEATFRTPPDATSASVGTVLHGTGTAWYDDAKLTLLTPVEPLRAIAGAPEQWTLAVAPHSPEWRVLGATHRAQLVARNWGDAEQRSLVAIAAGQLRSRLPRALRSQPLIVVDPATGEEMACVQNDTRLFLAARVPAGSEKVYHAYAQAPSLLPFARKPQLPTFASLAASEANLVQNAGFESEMESWTLSGDGIEGGHDPEAHSGLGCARFTVPADAPVAWRGWRQPGVAVKPNTTYLYAAYLRCRDVRDGSVQLHGHCFNAEGKHCAQSAFFGAGPPLATSPPDTCLNVRRTLAPSTFMDS